MRPVLLIIILLVACGLRAQTIRFSGNTKDTTGDQPLQNALMMAVKFNDSTLAGFSRTDKQGYFKPFIVKLDTYIVILSHPQYSDKTFFLVPSPNDTVFDFKNVVLPPKSVSIKEVEVLAYREKTYYKGDTLVFTADSFRTKANATVEDLLKRLPGFRVDAAGKITVQGKQVDQVLVDGDEFFGTDPTVATRNLAATTVENVQVYDKKNESSEENAEETLKVVNLKLKDGAKKGYFGKVSGASDFQNYYENELLANKFKGNQKISVFGLMANTPKQAFNWGDIDRYGLTGEEQWSYDEESGNWNNNQGDQRKGIPRTLKAGFYYADKLGEKTKVNADYTVNDNSLINGTETNTQFFLNDTTYSNLRKNDNRSTLQNHSLNLKVVSKFDSLTELTVRPRVRYTRNISSSIQRDDFISEDSVLTRRTILSNDNSNEILDVNTLLSIKRNFKKKDRALTLNYQPVYNSFSGPTRLRTTFQYSVPALPDSSLDQERMQENRKMENNASILFVEPWTKKIKSEFNYNFTHNHNSTNRTTYDVQQAGDDIFNPVFSNNFDNFRVINRAGTKLIYDVKKYRIAAGVNLRNVTQENTNITAGKTLTLSVNNILPNAMFVWRISQGSNLSLRYNTSSAQPDLQQMQPVLDNSDPNRISLGNPNLRPNFTNSFNFNYWFYKGISDVNFWSGANANFVDDQFSYETSFDSLGRARTIPINVDGSYYANMWLGGGFPVLKRFMKIYLSMNAGSNRNISYVVSRSDRNFPGGDTTRTISENVNVGPRVTFEKNSEKFEGRIEASYDYNVPRNNLNNSSQQPYYTYRVEASFEAKLPKKFSITGEGNYVNNGNRTPGFNLNYFIVNASLNKSFLKADNLILSVLANDILNQSISNERYITTNQIVDRKTQIIKRYFLLRLLYKFNSQQAPTDYEDR